MATPWEDQTMLLLEADLAACKVVPIVAMVDSLRAPNSHQELEWIDYLLESLEASACEQPHVLART